MVGSSARRRLLLTVYPTDGGAAQHVVDLALGLDANRWAIELACLPGSLAWTELGGHANVSLHALRGSHGRPTPNDFRDLPMLIGLVRRAHVVHAHSSKAGCLTRLAAWSQRRGRRTLFTPHGWSFWAATGFEARAYLALERLAAHWCRILVTVSEAERAAGLDGRVGRPEQYRVVLNGVDLEPYSGKPRPERGVIVFVGRLREPKRADLAVRALAILRRTRPEARLDLVGDGPLRAELEALAEREGVREAVRFVGTSHDVPELLKRACCLLLASEYEGCPLTVLEAMAAGVPVVASAVGGIPELVVPGETGYLVPAGDPEPFASALEQILADPARALELGAAGRRRAEALFTRERMVEDTETLYDEVATASAPGRPPSFE
jgi:glycosyltransferase involved in cell wall biosynthesis